MVILHPGKLVDVLLRARLFLLGFLLLVPAAQAMAQATAQASAQATAQAAGKMVGVELCDQPIGEVRISGNEVTRVNTITRELAIGPGIVCSVDAIEQSVQAMRDLGLFRSVTPELTLHDDLLVVHFIVVEKFFFFGLPRFSRTSDGELRYGFQLRWDNFTGRLHQLKLTSERRKEDDGAGRGGFVHSIKYNIPRLSSSRLGLALEAKAIRRDVGLRDDAASEEVGEATARTRALGVRVSRWVSGSSSVRGVRMFLGVGVTDRSFDLQNGKRGRALDGHKVELSLGFNSREIHDRRYARAGFEFGADMRIGSTVLGSDFQYHQLSTFLRYYHRLPGHWRNLNVQGRVGLSDGAPFGEQAFGIGGGDLLRGVQRDAADGDVLTVANIEYLQALSQYPTWRWVVFTDIGNVFDKDRIRLLKQKVRVGVGLRWKALALTNTDLRIDAAWDESASRLRTYVSTSLTF